MSQIIWNFNGYKLETIAEDDMGVEPFGGLPADNTDAEYSPLPEAADFAAAARWEQEGANGAAASAAGDKGGMSSAPMLGGEALRVGPDGTVSLLVQFERGTPPEDCIATLQEIGASNLEIIRPESIGDHFGALYRIDIPQDLVSAESLNALSNRPSVQYAEPDYAVSIQAASDDPGVTRGDLWGMYGDQSSIANPYGSQAAEAWEAGQTGSSSTIVGVIDSGIDYTHPDLYLNIWLNQREIPFDLRNALTDSDSDGLITFRDLNTAENASLVRDINRNGYIDAGDLLSDRRWENGIDEDGNGFTDDLIGWDFANNDNDPYDDEGHGTHVSGTIGAIGGNGTGVAGVNWNVQLVALKFLDASGGGYTSDAVQAVDYFTDAARNAAAGEQYVATNNSWGGGGYSRSLENAIARGAQENILFVAAAGNEGLNNDVNPSYPANLSTTQAAGYEAVVSVASLTSSGQLSGFSNYGAGTVDLAAPGSSILSTLPGGRYGFYSGTSMATPHVTGAVALYASEHPDATAAEIRAALLSSTVATASLTGKVANAGRLDVSQMLNTDAPVTPPAPPPEPVDAIAGDASTAAVLIAGEAQASTVDTAGDQDWFQVTVQAGHTYDLAMDAARGSSLDTYLRLVDEAGNTLAYNDDAVGLNSRLSFTAAADGTYFVSAQAYGTSTGDYVLTLGDTAPPPEPVDAIADDASTAAVLTAGEAQASTIDTAGDQDWFQVALRAGYTYELAMDAAPGSSLDTYLRLVDEAGNTLAYNDDAVGLNSRLSFTAAADGTYFVSAQAYGTSTGDYVLTMSESANTGEIIVGSNRSDRLFGTSGSDVMFGLDGRDRMYGGEGNDTIQGGDGNDLLFGNDGADTFVFDMAPDRRSNVDRIYDFTADDDFILLNHVIFNSLDVVAGISEENLVIGSRAEDGNDYLIYDPSRGRLFYDADGSGRESQQLVAVLPEGLALDADNFLVG